MKRAVLAIFMLWVVAFPCSAKHKRTIACKTPDNTNQCYWTRGRLRFYNGTPACRLWKVGTHRLLGIYSGSGAERSDPLDNEHPQLPPGLEGRFEPFHNEIYGDFEVCPLGAERPGAMQAACIEDVKNLVVVDFSKKP